MTDLNHIMNKVVLPGREVFEVVHNHTVGPPLRHARRQLSEGRQLFGFSSSMVSITAGLASLIKVAADMAAEGPPFTLRKRACYHAYCNAYGGLQRAFCGGYKCNSYSHYRRCKNHWENNGKREGRSPDPEACGRAYSITLRNVALNGRPGPPPSASPPSLCFGEVVSGANGGKTCFSNSCSTQGSNWLGPLAEAKALCAACAGCAALHDWGGDGIKWRACSSVSAGSGAKVMHVSQCRPSPPPPPYFLLASGESCGIYSIGSRSGCERAGWQCEWCGKQDSGFGSSLGLDGSGGRAGAETTTLDGVTVWLYPSSKTYPERGVSYGWQWTIATRPPGCFVETDIYQSVDRTTFSFNSKSPSQAAPCSAAHPCVCSSPPPPSPPPSPPLSVEVTSGRCSITDGGLCVASPSYPNTHSDFDGCVITNVPPGVPLRFAPGFTTDSAGLGCPRDNIYIKGNKYCGDYNNLPLDYLNCQGDTCREIQAATGGRNFPVPDSDGRIQYYSKGGPNRFKARARSPDRPPHV